MPQRPAPIAKSSSRSSKRSDAAPDAPALPGVSIPPDDQAIAVGEIVGAHGLRGLLRVRSYQPPAPSLTAGRHVLLERDGRWHEVAIRDASPHGRSLLLVGLDQVRDRTAAEALRGTRLLVRPADLPAIEADEFYHYEVVGFRVETLDGTPVGEIAETLSTGLHEVWVVRHGAREHLIPVVADVVRSLDRTARRVVIDPTPGLLD